MGETNYIRLCVDISHGWSLLLVRPLISVCPPAATQTRSADVCHWCFMSPGMSGCTYIWWIFVLPNRWNWRSYRPAKRSRNSCACMDKSSSSHLIASFPGCSHLQYSIACSMQIWRGRPGDLVTRVVTSGRQRVDTWGVVPNKALSCTISPRTGGQSISKTESIPFVVHDARDVLTQKRNTIIITVEHQPPCVYPM